MDGKEFIRITIYKPAIRNRYAPYRYIPHTRSWVPSIEDSFKWNDVKEVIVPVMDYLSEEGFEWFKNKGTFACYVGRTGILTGGNEPNVVSNGSAVTGEYKTRIEMWFLRI
jgi:alpha-glucosidase (family GH31 glycosyl hydrolase)